MVKNCKKLKMYLVKKKKKYPKLCQNIDFQIL